MEIHYEEHIFAQSRSQTVLAGSLPPANLENILCWTEISSLLWMSIFFVCVF